jgi:phosphate-selective porin OprO/OprP
MLRKIAVLVCGLSLGLAGDAPASDRVAKALLDALLANGQINQAQYQDLSRLAEDEAAAEEQGLPAVAAEPPKPGSLSLFWKDGIRMESGDGAFKLKLGGRLQNDWAVLAPQDDVKDAIPGSNGTGTEFRRARLQLAGTIYERFGFKFEYDFADGEVAFKDTFIEMLDLPYVGLFRVGHFKEPLSLEELTSDSYTTFMERALPNAFAPSRNTGFMVQNAPLEQRMTWAAGAFRLTDDAGNGFSSDPLYDLTARVTGLPWYEEGGRHLLHLGVGVSQQFRDEQAVSFSQRPEAHLAPRFVDTGSLPADCFQIVNPELALVYGPFSFQTEYNQVFVNGAQGVDDVDFYGVYAQVSWFLTGESRPYKTAEGIFDRVIPKHNFDMEGGHGAWELAARFSRLDLDDGGVDGGTLNDATFGVNWYLNPNMRITFNYVAGRLEDVGWTHQFESRFQIDM